MFHCINLKKMRFVYELNMFTAIEEVFHCFCDFFFICNISN